MIRLRSLQARLLALVLGLVAAVWMATAVMTWRDVRHELRELLDSHLAQAAAILVVQRSGELGEHGERHDRRVEAPTLHRYAPKVAFQVFHEGRLVLASANAPADPFVAVDRDRVEGFRSVTRDGTDWRVFTARGAESDILVHVAEQERSRSDILLAVLRGTLGPVLLAAPLLAAALWWAVHRGLVPLRGLRDELERREPGSLAPVPAEGAPAEMQPMIEALNRLLGRIAQLMESERRFTADAAHELRTPIAAIRAQAQVALGEADPSLRRHALQSTVDGCDRAARLVEQLLTLSRLDQGGAPEQGPVELRALVQQVLADAVPGALAKGQDLSLDCAPQGAAFAVRGSATLLAVLVRNLVDNAIRYSPRGARVVVGLQAAPSVSLRIEDTGPGLKEEELARLGERFFRVLGSGEAGSGLGWSIVRRIASAHGIEVRVDRSEALGGLAVRLAFPA